MKILLGYNYYKHPFIDIGKTMEDLLSRLRIAGIDIHGFPLTVDPPGKSYYWKELNSKWKRGDKKLLNLYDKLGEKSKGFDVFINYNGLNLHPDFVGQLSTFNIYSCFDDPESSDILSKPVAWAYDMSFVGNIAEVETYKGWGIKEVRFFPLGFFATEYDPKLTKADILNKERTNDIALLCEQQSGYRASRLNKYSKAFKQGMYYGLGWPNGYYPDNKRIALYQNTKIGPNFHNSTGPINFRTYMLPANGVLQICDNKSDLGKIFKLDREVVGFDTVEEAIEKTKYYLANDEERRKIAVAGWERALNDYNEVAVFSLIEKYVQEINLKKKPILDKLTYLKTHRKKTFFFRIINFAHFLKKILSLLKRLK